MEFVGAVRPREPWPHPHRTVQVCIETRPPAAGEVRVSILDPATERAGNAVHTRAFDGFTEMVRALLWCERTFTFEASDLLAAWDHELGSECPVCLEPVAAGAAGAAAPRRCGQCPQRYHRGCLPAGDPCPVCRRSA